jgi:hypothetical protein
VAATVEATARASVPSMTSSISADTVELLWDVADASDPHINRPMLAYLRLLILDEQQVRDLLRELLEVFERLGRERPYVVQPFLGVLLAEVQERGL